MKNKTLWLIIGFIVVIGALFAWSNIAASKKQASMTTREVAMSCTTDMATEFHIHPHLEIKINGEALPMLADIGVTGNCMNPLHTHDTTGIIHVESPVKRDFTLADFFAVWDKPFSQDEILDHKADDTHIVTMTINGQRVDTFENTILRDNEQIVISYEAK